MDAEGAYIDWEQEGDKFASLAGLPHRSSRNQSGGLGIGIATQGPKHANATVDTDWPITNPGVPSMGGSGSWEAAGCSLGTVGRPGLLGDVQATLSGRPVSECRPGSTEAPGLGVLQRTYCGNVCRQRHIFHHESATKACHLHCLAAASHVTRNVRSPWVFGGYRLEASWQGSAFG